MQFVVVVILILILVSNRFEKITFKRTKNSAKLHSNTDDNTGLVQVVVFEVEDRESIGGSVYGGQRAVCCTPDLGKIGACTQGEIIHRPSMKNSGWPKVFPVYFQGDNIYTTMESKLIKIKSTGMYNLYFIHCDADLKGLLVDGKAIWKNPTGYLPGRMAPLMNFYGFMSLAYVLLGIVWFSWYARFWREVMPLQNCITLVIALGMFEMALWYFEYAAFNTTGIRPSGITMWAVTFGTIKRSVSRVLLLVVSMGYGVVRPTLGGLTSKVLLLGGTFFLASEVLELVENVGSVSDFSGKERLFLVLPVALLDAFFIVWIFTSLSKTLNKLQLRRMTAKLDIYRKFTNALLVSVFVSIGWICYEVHKIWGHTLPVPVQHRYRYGYATGYGPCNACLCSKRGGSGSGPGPEPHLREALDAARLPSSFPFFPRLASAFLPYPRPVLSAEEKEKTGEVPAATTVAGAAASGDGGSLLMEYQRRGKKRVEPSTEAQREPSPAHSDAHTPQEDDTSGQQNAQASVGAPTPQRQTPPVDQHALLLTTLQTLTSIVQSMAGNQRSQASPTGDTTAPPKEKATTVTFHHFMTMQPPVFTGDGSPDKAEAWIEEIERIFEVLEVPGSNKVKYGSYMLKGDAQRWWKSTREIQFADQQTISWRQFRDSFFSTYFPVQARNKKMQEFLDLQQNHLSLEEYVTKYRHLEAYCPHLYTTAEARADKFVYGLRDGLRGRVMSSSPRNLDEAVTRARRMEEDWARTQRDHQKKTSQHTQGGRMPVKHHHPTGRARPYERRDGRAFRQSRPGRSETTQGSVASPTSP
ncbi:Transmembrane protein, partial [Nymphaea thermarum]